MLNDNNPPPSGPKGVGKPLTESAASATASTRNGDDLRRWPAWTGWPLWLSIKLRTFNPHDFVTPEAFSVRPELLGTPLARPVKRLLAWGVDALAVAIMAQLSNIFLALALALLCDRILRQTEFLVGDRWRQHLRMVLVAGFVAWAALQGWSQWREKQQTAPVATARTAAALSAAANDEADKEVETVAEKLTDAQRIEMMKDKIGRLQHKIDKLKDQQGFSLLDSVKNLLGDVGFDFGWAAIYWTLITAWWNGQTLGKRLFGLRVLQLNGQPLTMWDSFNRCGGYAAGLATGLLGFAQVWWDPNRQAIHDKVSFTVVADERRAKRPWPIES